MSNDETHGLRAFWDSVAEDWHTQVGDEGDRNRRLNSDPVLWAFAGEVAGLRVLDAGCGTGYLTRKLHALGAQATGVDFSERMIAVARRLGPAVDFRVDSCTTLATIPTASIDLLLSNYVLMDVADLEAAVGAFARVLRAGGRAVLVFSHPCLPAGRASRDEDGVTWYRWDFPYFERRRCTDPPWAHFSADFIWFHRPLSDYWKAFKRSGFQVEDFDEPRAADQPDARPYSVAFALRKGETTSTSAPRPPGSPPSGG